MYTLDLKGLNSIPQSLKPSSNMGKKNKKSDKNSETNETQSETVNIADISKDKKSRKRNHNNESLDIVNKKQVLKDEDSQQEILYNVEKSNTRKKIKDKDTEIIDNQKTSQLTSKKSEQIDQQEETKVQKTSNKKDKVKNKNKIQENVQSKSRNKKIIFEEETGEPVEEGNKNDNVNEENVKEEDIDQFCDGITEEDNVQYENWVQLIEAKLKSNKPKSNT